MPLERFIPKSPDPFIRNSQDFEVAKFGHLNTIIEYVNTYVAADSLQLAGTGPLTSTARYITDSLGNASSLAISTTRVGIGTVTPLVPLDIIGNTNLTGILTVGNYVNATGFGQRIRVIGQGDASVGIYRNQASAFAAKLEFMKSRGTYDAPTIVNTNDILGSIGYFGYNGTSYINAASINSVALSTATGVEGDLRFTVWNNTGGNVNIMRATKDGVGIGSALDYLPSATLQVRGSGSTSATTSLLVQNSIGTNLLQVKDNGLLTSNVDNEGGAFSIDVDTNAQTTLKLKPFGNNFNAAYQAQIYNYYGNLVIKSAAYGNVTTELFGNGQYKITDNFAYPYLTVYGANVGGKSVFGRPVEIKGIGSTSATTSLLVQNSSSTTTLSVNDAGTVTTGGDIFAGTIQIGKGKSTGIYNVVMGQYPLAAGTGSSTVSYTTAIGQTSGFNIASGTYNVIIGAESVASSTAVNNSVIIGSQVLARTTSAISNTLAIGTGNTSNYYPTIYATNINTDSPNVRIGNNSAATAAVPTAPTASAILELSSTTKGFLPPRMTTTQRTGIVLPAAGLIVYDTDTNKSYTYDGTAWQAHW